MSGETPGPSPGIGDLEDLFENAPCGYLSTGADGRIGRANATLAGWIGVEAASLAGKRFSDLLTIGGKLYHETHLAPLLRMQGSFSEVALDLARADGGRLPVLVNAVERRDAAGKPLFVRITVFDASERRRYERNLVAAKTAAERATQAEHAAAELREQFIAVLGHDLRNPLAAIAGGVTLLGKAPTPERAREILDLMQGGVARASALIDDVMDFARGRLGGGIAVVSDPDAPIAPVIVQVVDEARSMAGDRPIEARIAIEEPVEADHGRIGQLVSNLLGNALSHGAPDQPIRLTAQTVAGIFEVRVVNGGEPIPPAVTARLFQPFFRDAVRPSRQGLGLGLYIASEIAKAHGGEIVVESCEGEICFTFKMPCRREAAGADK